MITTAALAAYALAQVYATEPEPTVHPFIFTTTLAGCRAQLANTARLNPTANLVCLERFRYPAYRVVP